jgi:MFS family permease
VLPVLVLAQLLGTSPWFAVNAVMPELQALHGWGVEALGTLTSALQIGFIVGTLVFALLSVADRFPARHVFFACALAAGACTLAAAVVASAHGGHAFAALLAWRAATGFFLAGIYPVGMKIAAMWFPQGLGAALGWLIGALVLGSAAPHGLRAIGATLPWQAVFGGVAALAAAAGVLLLRGIPEPPGAAARTTAGLRFGALASLWTDRRVRASAFGYYGHMVELYTMWVLVPLLIAERIASPAAVSGTAFVVLGAGVFGCVLGGLVARRVGSAKVAAAQLATSGACCLAAPWLVQAPLPMFIAWLFVWGVTVSGDSPQFSALTATNAPKAAVGSVLTLNNSIGFALSVLSIELFVRLAATVPLGSLVPWLALGPAAGLVMLAPLLRRGA